MKIYGRVKSDPKTKKTDSGGDVLKDSDPGFLNSDPDPKILGET